MEAVEIKLDEARVSSLAGVISRLSEQMGEKMDDGESIFFARQLEFIKAREFSVDYPELKARRIIPISTEVDPGAETITYRQYDMVGAAKVISDYSDDLPSFDALGKEFTSKIVGLGGSYGYSIQELRAAIMAKKSLDRRKQEAAVFGMRKKENTILFMGDSAHNILGFLKAAAADGLGGNVPTVSIPADGAGATKTWSTKSSVQIIRDLSLLLRTVREQTKGIENATTILLPLSSWGIINSKPYSDLSDKTVLQWFLANNPGIEIDWLNELETAGASSVRRSMAFTRRPEKVEGQIPQDYEQLPPQPDGLRFSIPCHSRVGGVIWYKPFSAVYGDGI